MYRHSLSKPTMQCLSSHVQTQTLKCGWDGLIKTQGPYSKCRLAKTCPTPFYTIPAETHLVKYTGAANPDPAQEKDTQLFVCDADYTLSGVSHAWINADGRVAVPCEVDAADPPALAPVTDWPTCVPIQDECTTLPKISGLTRLTNDPVPRGGYLHFRDGRHYGFSVAGSYCNELEDKV